MIPTSKLPGHYDQHRKYHVNQRNAKLIREHNGKIVKYRDLPVESQLALAQYMSIDGEAWELAPGLETAMEQHHRLFPDTHNESATKAWQETMLRFLPFYTQSYGGYDFGYIEALPLMKLIESCMTDAELNQDWGGLSGWQEYHKWYSRSGMKHSATSEKPWPVILSSFSDETLEDGWNRFHWYAERQVQTCPAIWFPRQQSREGAAARRKLAARLN